jgi:hypothetical protein
MIEVADEAEDSGGVIKTRDRRDVKAMEAKRGREEL